jgi:hypothetical protein
MLTYADVCHALQAQLEEESTLFQDACSSALGPLKNKTLALLNNKKNYFI